MIMFEEKRIENKEFELSQPVLVGNKSSHEPDIAATAEDEIWVAWSERSHDGDIIKAKNTGKGIVFDISENRGIEFQPAVCSLDTSSIFIVWVAYRNKKWHLLTRSIEDDQLGKEEIIYSNAEGVFRPRLVRDNNGTFWLACESVINHTTQITIFSGYGGKWSKPKILKNDEIENCYRPSIALGPNQGVWTAYDGYGGEQYDIYIQRVDKTNEPIKVTNNGFQNLQNSICSDGDGNLWIVWACNKNQAFKDRWWLTKWTYLRMFDGSDFFDPCCPSPGVDVYDNGPYQGMEFPEVVVDQSKRVWIFGQASHTQYAQYYKGQQWSPLYTISQKYWGSWKPRFRAVRSGKYIYAASFGLEGAKIQRIRTTMEETSPVLVPRRELDVIQTKPRIKIKRTIIKSKSNQSLQIYFGDLHAHSIYGDGVGDIDEIYNRYRDAYGYDFAAITEHDYLDGIELSESEFKMICNYATRFNDPGKFVTFSAYEWTSPAIEEHVQEGQKVGEGHKNIYFAGEDGLLYGYGNEKYNSGAKLLQNLKSKDVLVIPHHTSWSGIRWDDHDEKIQRLIEICSIHGRFEYPGNKPIGYRRDHVHLGEFVIDGLNKGYKFGFVGGSDSHGTKWHHTELEGRNSNIAAGTRVGWKRDAYRGGMTAIIAPDLDRATLYDALSKRHCYATSGEPIIIDFRINDELMGSELKLDFEPNITAYVEGTAPIRTVEVIRSGNTFSSLQTNSGEAINSIQFSVKDQMITRGECHYYYLRVIQEDGNMAWSSPIWVNYQEQDKG